jgi:hypothetical protein
MKDPTLQAAASECLEEDITPVVKACEGFREILQSIPLLLILLSEQECMWKSNRLD